MTDNGQSITSDDERYIRQGRARDEVKKLEARIAELHSEFRDYIEALDIAKSTVTSFLANPTAKAADDRLIIDHVNAIRNKLLAPELFDNTDELFRATKKLRELHAQIEN